MENKPGKLLYCMSISIRPRSGWFSRFPRGESMLAAMGGAKPTSGNKATSTSEIPEDSEEADWRHLSSTSRGPGTEGGAGGCSSLIEPEDGHAPGYRAGQRQVSADGDGNGNGDDDASDEEGKTPGPKDIDRA